MSAQTATAPMSNLAQKVLEQRTAFQNNREEILAQKKARREAEQERRLAERQQAVTQLVEQLKRDLPERVSEALDDNTKTEVAILEFTYGDALKVGEFYVKDLLNNNDVLAQVQTWLDTEHAQEDGSRTFLIHFRQQMSPQREHNKYSVLVNWDATSWERIRKRTLQSRSRGHSHQRRHPRRKELQFPSTS